MEASMWIPNEKNGGLALWWDRQVKIFVSSSNQFFMNAFVEMNQGRKSFKASFT